MAKMRFGLVLIALMTLAGAAKATEPPPGPPDQAAPSEMLMEGTRQILKAFELFIRTIPQYNAPEVLENGDIIIRRKVPGATPPEKDKTPAPDTTDKTRT